MCTTTQKRSRSESQSPQIPVKRPRSASASGVPIRFLILSDTHGHKLPSNYPECDVVLHCGDLTEDGSPESIASALESLGNIKAELRLAIAGNHEISLDGQYFKSEGGSDKDHSRAVSLVKAEDSEAVKHGVVFLNEGTHSFTLKSGATFRVYTSPYTPQYDSSAFQYPSGEDRFNPPHFTPQWASNTSTADSLIPENIDIVMTHGPPKYLLDSTSDGRSAGCEHLRRAIARVRPRFHCFGHIHGGYGAQRIHYETELSSSSSTNHDVDGIITMTKEWVGKNQAKRKGYASLPPSAAEDFRNSKDQTLMVNAAMENSAGELENAPWIVELDFPVLEIAESGV
ncbi:Metallo-dependent phosphatase-like protein [Lophiotrema nucula]|uniref:Metallo-dependent phosphatase-like protein n=1 Tax=Lophiotrema nucula TaxID=690887 RepID=A0A6A5YSQ3_9PLEO|nr:Metallo-dependent phosphatase-like protein [Lophiotrema nucula]